MKVPDLYTTPLKNEEIKANPTHSLKFNLILKDFVMWRSLLPFMIIDNMVRNDRPINKAGVIFEIR